MRNKFLGLIVLGSLCALFTLPPQETNGGNAVAPAFNILGVVVRNNSTGKDTYYEFKNPRIVTLGNSIVSDSNNVIGFYGNYTPASAGIQGTVTTTGTNSQVFYDTTGTGGWRINLVYPASGVNYTVSTSATVLGNANPTPDIMILIPDPALPGTQAPTSPGTLQTTANN